MTYRGPTLDFRDLQATGGRTSRANGTLEAIGLNHESTRCVASRGEAEHWWRDEHHQWHKGLLKSQAPTRAGSAQEVS